MKTANEIRLDIYSQFAKEALAAWEKAEGKLPAPTKRSEKAAALEKLLPSFGCNAKQVGEVLSILLGEKVGGQDRMPVGAFVRASGYTMLACGHTDDGVECVYVEAGSTKKLEDYVMSNKPERLATVQEARDMVDSILGT